jgi:serine phosphatase RsbU (regulator of sigma subunit)
MEPEGRLEPKLLYRRLDGLLGAFDPARPGAVLMRSFLADAFRFLGDDLRLKAGTLYTERRDDFERVDGVGDEARGMPETLDPSSCVLRLVLHHGVYLFDAPLRGEGAGDPVVPWPSATAGEPALPWPSAAVVVGVRPSRHVLWFALRKKWVREEVDFALNTIRAALGSRLADERVQGSFRQAAQIQQSLLLDEPPAFPGYELAARSVAAEEVGGDFYDFFSFGDELLGLAIGDASGHGLPAALLVRDVVTGLRMGLEKDLKMGYVFAKLNRVIYRSNLSSRFVSVFYAELEENGNLIYVNAGHPPPLIFTAAAGVRELTIGGTVIGPLPEALFRRGIAYLEIGDVLLLTTDGILERRSATGDFFGQAGVESAVRDRDSSASEILERVFAAASAFGDGPWEDDATIVVVKRTGRP